MHGLHLLLAPVTPSLPFAFPRPIFGTVFSNLSANGGNADAFALLYSWRYSREVEKPCFPPTSGVYPETGG